MGDASQLRAEAPLPTLSKLGNPDIPADLDAATIASEWLLSFGKYASKGDVDGLMSIMIQSSFQSRLFAPDGADDMPLAADEVSVYWRDILALTWDLRTFEGTPKIAAFLGARLAGAQISNVQLQTETPGTGPPALARPFPDLAWIQVFFTFETAVGLCSGIARLVPLVNENKHTVWKAHTIFTNLDDLKGFPEKIGHLRNHLPNHGKWEAERAEEVKFEGKNPSVLIIGGGHSGLDVAARLKMLGVSHLVIDKNPRIGDNWRTRYEALCLHDPVWYDHMPYIPFPASWPVFTPAKKLANWLESYVDAMELNVWTSSTVMRATQDDATKKWTVLVRKPDGSERTFTVNHIVLATGFKGGKGYIPTYPGMGKFKGQILHSTQHNKATDHAGKKVVVVGACTAAHDLSVDYADHGVDVTMFQRSSTYVVTAKNLFAGSPYHEGGPPIEIADKVSESFPRSVNGAMGYRGQKITAEDDRDILDGLEKRGFRINKGFKDCGILLAVYHNAGGYYIDVGGSQYIIDGKVKLKNDSQIAEFTPSGLKFENGSELEADVVVFCTGLADASATMREILGDDVVKRAKPVWGLNEEGEIQGCWGDSGVPNMYNMMGNLALCRFYSKRIALQIKAMDEGINVDRYGA